MCRRTSCESFTRVERPHVYGWSTQFSLQIVTDLRNLAGECLILDFFRTFYHDNSIVLSHCHGDGIPTFVRVGEKYVTIPDRLQWASIIGIDATLTTADCRYVTDASTWKQQFSPLQIIFEDMIRNKIRFLFSTIFKDEQPSCKVWSQTDNRLPICCTA